MALSYTASRDGIFVATKEDCSTRRPARSAGAILFQVCLAPMGPRRSTDAPHTRVSHSSLSHKIVRSDSGSGKVFTDTLSDSEGSFPCASETRKKNASNVTSAVAHEPSGRSNAACPLTHDTKRSPSAGGVTFVRTTRRNANSVEG